MATADTRVVDSRNSYCISRIKLKNDESRMAPPLAAGVATRHAHGPAGRWTLRAGAWAVRAGVTVREALRFTFRVTSSEGPYGSRATRGKRSPQGIARRKRDG